MGQNDFGMMLRDIRTRAGKSLGDTARHLAIGIVYLSDVERGIEIPLHPEKIEAACAFFGVDPKELLAAATTEQNLTGPWPVREILRVLSNAADHLLLDHDCDADGHEEIALARDEARRILRRGSMPGDTAGKSLAAPKPQNACRMRGARPGA